MFSCISRAKSLWKKKLLETEQMGGSCKLCSAAVLSAAAQEKQMAPNQIMLTHPLTHLLPHPLTNLLTNYILGRHIFPEEA